jgi:Flp pilus assembly protein TadD
MNKKCCLGFYTLAAMAALPVLGAGSGSAGSSGQPVVKQGSPAVKAYNEGIELMRAKQFAPAQHRFEQAVKDDPGFAEAHNNLAFTLRKQGRGYFSQALAHYNRAIQLKPALAEASMYRGVLYTQMGQKTEAQADPAALKRLNPHLARELEAFLKTAQEDDELYGAARKMKS